MVDKAADSIRNLIRDGWCMLEDDGFLGLVGPIWRKDDNEGFSLGFLAEPKHRNRHGVVQGGMLATLADRTLGLTARANEPTRAQVTIHLDVNYLDSARIGEFVSARGVILRQTSSLAFMVGQIFAEARLIAHVSGIWRIRPGTNFTSLIKRARDL